MRVKKPFSVICSMRFLFTIFVLFGFYAQAQVAIEIRNDPRGISKELKSDFTDSLELRNYFNSKINVWRANGFLLANVDSLYGNFPDVVVKIYVGDLYELSTLRFSNIPDEIQNKLKNKPRKYLRETYKKEEVEELLEEIISYSENNGYPFAKVSLDSIKVTGKALHAQLNYSSGPYITFDSVFLEAKFIKPQFLAAYLGIIHGNAYDQSIIDHIPQRLNRILYLEVVSNPKITFSNEACQVHLFIKPRKSNRLDGYLGIFPNSNGDNLLITGKLDIQLRNLFRSGKSLDLFWEKQQIATQKLVVDYAHPNLFRSPVGLIGGIDLYKQDTAFINRKLLLGINFLSKNNDVIAAYSSWESSRKTSQQPSDSIIDFNLNNFGLRFRKSPSRGFSSSDQIQWAYDIGGTIGKKSVLNISSGDSAYLDINSESVQFSMNGEISGQVRVKRSFFIYGKASSGVMINDQLFINDLYRLGGLNSIRGFYENQFYASEYITGTIEGRFYFGLRSNLVAFFDYGSISYTTIRGNYEDSPFGFGIGTNVQTSAGILSLNYAVGKSNQQPLDLKFSKIHIGYIATF